MTQVPASSHGGFTGGTIAGATTVDTRPDNATVAFRVRAGDAATSGLDAQFDPSVPAFRLEGLDGYGTIVLTDDFSGGTLTLRSGGLSLAANGGNIVRQQADGSLGVSLRASGVWLAVHAAPDDADLSAGDLVLWFDQTNGVGNTKLMVKAKSADGTVKTAAVVLT